MSNVSSDGLREAITKLLHDDPVCCGRVSLATIGDIAALSHPTPALDAGQAFCENIGRIPTQRDTIESLGHIKALAEYAYKNGFHELGYDPVSVLSSALARHHPAFDAAAVREACAKVADAKRPLSIWSLITEGYMRACEDIAAAIRTIPIPEAPASVDDETLRFAQQIVGIANSLQSRDALDSEFVSVKLIRAVAGVVNGEAFRLAGFPPKHEARLADHEITSKTVDDSGEAVGCQQEAVAWMYSQPHPMGHTFRYVDIERWDDDRKDGYTETPLYAHPAPQAQGAATHADDCEAMLRPRADCTCAGTTTQPDPLDPAFGGGVK